MKKPVYYVILALLVGVFLFAAYKVGSYYLEKYRSDKVISEANRFVTLPGDSDNNDPTQDPSGDPECPTVQFDELLKTNGDVIAWIYGANTHINYPVVQGSDNDYYLRHLLDGTWKPYDITGSQIKPSCKQSLVDNSVKKSHGCVYYFSGRGSVPA